MGKVHVAVFAILLSVSPAARAQHTITTVAGGVRNNVSALSVGIGYPGNITRDSGGNLYFAGGPEGVIYKLNTSGQITVVAGNGTFGPFGDGGPATSAAFAGINAVSVDGSGNLFIADSNGIFIREVVAATGIIRTVAGTGQVGSSGDGGPATSAGIGVVTSLFVDGSGNLFIGESQGLPSSEYVREVVAATGIIRTVAGTGPAGFSGDGGPATSAEFNGISSIFVDTSGNLFIADSVNNRVRELVAATGIIRTVAGTGVAGFSGDGGVATSAQLNRPGGVVVDSSGNIFIAEPNNNRVREVVAATGIIQTVAGGGLPATFSGDGGPATSAKLNAPSDVVVDGSGNLFIADSVNSRIREVAAATGIIQTVAGNGTPYFSGDGGVATGAELASPKGIAADNSGNIFIADVLNDTIREVVAATGIIRTVAGTGSTTGGGDGGPATSAGLFYPYSVATDGSGNLFIADYGDNCIREVFAATGIIQTVAGQLAVLTKGFGGDGGPATSALLNTPLSVAVDRSGNLFISDSGNNRIREVVAATGVIRTVAGNGTAGFGGDGGPATSAELSGPGDVFVDASGNLFIADNVNNRIREVVAATGVIQTVAGNGTAGFGGDGGLATSAELLAPQGVFVDAAGNLFIADTANYRIREVTAATGIIQTVAGNGTRVYSGGDGGPATSAGLDLPASVFGDGSGNLLIADRYSNRIRRVVGLVNVTGISPDFSIGPATGASTSATFTAGQSATLNAQVNPINGFTGTVILACTGAPALSSCTTSPMGVNVVGSSAVPFTITITTTARSLAIPITFRSWPPRPNRAVSVTLILLLALAISTMAIIVRSRQMRAWIPAAILLICVATFATACAGGGGAGGGGGGNGSPGTPPGTYNLTVTGTSQGVNRTATVTLTVQ
jgi:sugar lactone lactonase YvrE